MNNQETDWLLQEKYGGEKSVAFFADCARLEAGEPLAYLIGSIPFLNCQITLDSHPLIPRPETEYWVEQAIIHIQDTIPRGNLGSSLGFPSGEAESRGRTPKILDLCAGSGAIGVAVAKAIPEAHVTFAELDPAHLPTIEKNITQNTPFKWSILGDENRFVVQQSDLFTNITATFDFILTNPPYIDKDAHTVDDSVTAHEPHLALFGGVGGMEIIERIIVDAREHITPNGQLWIEHEPFQSTAITLLAATHGYVCQTHPDQYGTLRYSVLTLDVAE
jgi:release factor glutamine methyltransferase